MAVITISRGTYSKGKEIAERVAEELGYACVSREVLLTASEQFNVTELQLVNAIHDAPSLLERLGHRKQAYVAYIQAALLRQLAGDNVVYHGLAGHFFVTGISHALRVRIIADMEDRVRLEVDRKGIDREEARRILEQDDEERRKWSLHLYGIDTRDPSLYDLVIHLGNLGVPEAVRIVCDTARLDRLRTTPESREAMQKLLLAAEVRVALLALKEDLDVAVHAGKVCIHLRSGKEVPGGMRSRIEEVLRDVEGLDDVCYCGADTAYQNPWHNL